MKKSIQLSIKIDPDTFDAIEGLVKELRYYKRNAVIAGVLMCVTQECYPEGIKRMVRYSKKWGWAQKKGVKFELMDVEKNEV